MTIIEARNVSKEYGVGEVTVPALRGVSLTVEKGEFTAIMGPSGSGKSTLLTILGGIERPSSGAVLIEGTDLASLDDDQRTKLRRRRIGFIFQSFNLLPNLTAEENVALPMELDGRPRDEAYQLSSEVLELVEMSHRKQHLPSALSGGEQQRIAIARALAIKPALLLADEPTGNLDSRQAKRISELLESLAKDQGQTIVMVTHDPAVANTAWRIIGLRDGIVEHDGSPEEVLASFELLSVKEN